jgi:hypothetical protein
MAYKNGGSGWAPGAEKYAGEFGSINPGGLLNIGPNKYYGGGSYMTIAANPNIPGWGNYVPPGYEKVAWEPTSIYGPRGGYNGPGTGYIGTGTMLLRRTGQQEAAAPQVPTPPPTPTVTPRDPEPLVPTPGPSNSETKSPYSDEIADLLKQLANRQNAPAPVSAPTTIQLPDPGYTSSTAVAGNASGFTRKQSSARKAGLTTKGTSRLRISRTGQTTASSGLNIGV